MSDFAVHGADDFLRLSKALKGSDLRKALNKGVREAVKPATKKAAERLADGMPSAELQRKAKRVTLRTQVRTGADPGVTVGVPFKRGSKTGLGSANARLVNRLGLVRHPVFGDRSRWASTPVDGRGWFDKTVQDAAPEVRKGIEQAMQDVADEVVRRARG